MTTGAGEETAAHPVADMEPEDESLRLTSGQPVSEELFVGGWLLSRADTDPQYRSGYFPLRRGNSMGGSRALQKGWELQ